MKTGLKSIGLKFVATIHKIKLFVLICIVLQIDKAIVRRFVLLNLHISTANEFYMRILRLTIFYFLKPGVSELMRLMLIEFNGKYSK